MVASLELILPYIQEDAIDSIPFDFLLKALSNNAVINSSSQVEHQTLIVRILTLLRNHKLVIKWKASKLITICMTHPVLLINSNVGNLITELIKILENKCFINNFENPSRCELTVLNSCIESLEYLYDQIRGKPTLTREILTPRLNGIIGSLIEILPILTRPSLKFLNKILINNSTTFRPFGSKFEKNVKNILNEGENYNKIDKLLKNELLKSYSLCKFILNKDKQSDYWNENFKIIILEIKSLISIYETLIDFSNDKDFNNKFNLLPNISDDKSISKKFLFNSLIIDINESPIEILKISDRIKLLIEILISFININIAIKISIPIGNLNLIGEILMSINCKFTPINNFIRDLNTIKIIETSLNEIKNGGILIFNLLIEKFGIENIPNLNKNLSILDSSIPVLIKNNKIKIDNLEILQNENLILNILECSNKYLQLVDNFNDMSVIGRMIDAALVLHKSRLPEFSNSNNEKNVNNGSGMGKKKQSKKNTISMSDILSHREEFLINVPKKTIKIIRKFFNTLISRCELSSGKLSIILRFVIIDAIENLNNGDQEEEQDIVELLETVLLFPGKFNNSVSVIPMISNLIGDRSRVYSLLVNPRFPVMAKRVTDEYVMENNEEDEEEEEEEDGEEAKEVEDVVQVKSVKREHEEEQGSESSKRRQVDQEFVFSNTESANKAIETIQQHLNDSDKAPKTQDSEKPKEEAEVEVEMQDNNNDDDDDDGSDFEIPAINVE